MHFEKHNNNLLVMTGLVFVSGFLGLFANYLRNNMLLSKAHSTPRSTSENEEIVWNTYVDEEYGFSVDYPQSWGILSQDDMENGKKTRVSLDKFTIQNCTNAQDYMSTLSSINKSDVTITPIDNSVIDGFLVEGKLLDKGLSNSEAYLVNCPTVLKISYFDFGSEKDELIFRIMVSSVKFIRDGNSPTQKNKPDIFSI